MSYSRYAAIFREHKKRRTAVSLFSGAGGLDIGVEAAGFEVLAAVERDANACETLRLNFTGPHRETQVEIIERDIKDLDVCELLKRVPRICPR